jgi:putative NADPH-quinone reductase
MPKILVLNGHPDGSPDRFCAALAEAYCRGAYLAGWQVRRANLADLPFPMITDRVTFEKGTPPPNLADLQCNIQWADHLVIIFPLWLGSPPARLKGLLEQTFRYGFALGTPGGKGQAGGLLKGRSARLIVTMGMPAIVFRLLFGAFGVRAVERGILFLSGFHPIRRTLVGGIETATPAQRAAILRKIEALGRRGI